MTNKRLLMIKLLTKIKYEKLEKTLKKIRDGNEALEKSHNVEIHEVLDESLSIEVNKRDLI